MHTHRHLYVYIHYGLLGNCVFKLLGAVSLHRDELIIHFRLEDEEYLAPDQHMVKCL